jgi:hypothetical protein
MSSSRFYTSVCRIKRGSSFHINGSLCRASAAWISALRRAGAKKEYYENRVFARIPEAAREAEDFDVRLYILSVLRKSILLSAGKFWWQQMEWQIHV